VQQSRDGYALQSRRSPKSGNHSVILSHEMDLGEEVQKLLDADMELDEDYVDMLKAAACLL